LEILGLGREKGNLTLTQSMGNFCGRGRRLGGGGKNSGERKIAGTIDFWQRAAIS